MHEQSIIDAIVSRLDICECNVKTISLICTAEALTKRLQKDVETGLRQPEIIEQSLSRTMLYDNLDTLKIDVSDITAEEAADLIIKV